MCLRAVFSDIDGTLVSYKAKLEQDGYELLPTTTPSSSSYEEPRIARWRHKPTGQIIEALHVPSATLGGGFISVRTLRLIEKLRGFGVKFCVLTGARTSTFLARCSSGTLPFDYGVCEGGGKIFTPDQSLDEEWISKFDAVTGRNKKRINPPPPPEQRPGALWDLYRLLLENKDSMSSASSIGAHLSGLKLDAKSYDTAFMVDIRPSASVSSVMGVGSVSKAEAALRQLVEQNSVFRELLVMKVNLGKAHVTPKGCTKKEVTEYLSAKMGVSLASSSGGSCAPKSPSCLASCSAFPSTSNAQKAVQMRAQQMMMVAGGEAAKGGHDNHHNNNHNGDVVAALFDDENDLEFADLCHVGFAIGIAHPAVEEFIKRKQQQQSSRGQCFAKVPVGGFLGTEFALQNLIDRYCVFERKKSNL